ncbi:MAG TPA: LacI family DNA-binding transcriptional regulator [Vicinamibacteria bacterium]|nr:LacI family DNA-binding transcriptional regulator [Vicinamibacteria bacterium]
MARLAGVSSATVSRVLNGSGTVSEAHRHKVLRAVETLDYHPNAGARTLASGRSTQIGLLVSDICNPFFAELAKSIERAALQSGFEVMLSETDYDSERLNKALRRFLERSVAGVMVMASELELDLVDRLARRGVPLVLLDLESRWPRTSTVRVDYARGIDEAVRHLAALGHRRLAFIGGPRGIASAATRVDAFTRAVERHIGASHVARSHEADFQLEGGFKAAVDILAGRPRPTAVLAANDWMAMGILKACRTQGLRVPRDISIVGFDDIAFAKLTDPPLSTVCLPRDELGRRAVEALMLSLQAHSDHPPEVQVPTHFVPRGTTGPALGAGVRSAALTAV